MDGTLAASSKASSIAMFIAAECATVSR
jgi:hypothetical protein